MCVSCISHSHVSILYDILVRFVSYNSQPESERLWHPEGGGVFFMPSAMRSGVRETWACNDLREGSRTARGLRFRVWGLGFGV